MGKVAPVPPALREGKMTRWVWPILALLTSLALAQPGQAQDRIRLGHNANSVRSIGSLPLHVVMRQRLFAREGLIVELVGLPGTTHMVDALDSGTVDVTGTATPYLIQATLNGSDAVAVVGGPANAVYSLIAKPEIATAAELRGKLVAMSTPADTISLSTRLLLAKHGVGNSDYRTKELVGSNARGTCLVSGECDAVPLGQPDDIVLVQKGFRNLGDSLEVLPVQQFNVLAARRAWAVTHKDIVARVARAYGAAFRFLRDPGNRNEIAALIADTTGAPAEVALRILALYYEPDRGVMPKQAEINMAGMAKVIEMLAETGQIAGPRPPVERFVDLQYLQAAGLQ
jgi:ABC-type nitrate/sulfonate/bicarbonate transport system substrate-binding protein